MDPHLIPINTPSGKYEEDSTDTRNTSKGNKRTFSHTISEYSSQEEDSNSGCNSSDENLRREDEPFEKRHRASDWPLGNNCGSSEEHDTTFAVNGIPPSTRKYSDKHRILRPRASRFIEGSMNNRVSQKPPVAYVASRNELNHFGEKESTKREKPRHMIRNSKQSTAKPEESSAGAARQSSIFRFGKSLATTFNPSNWKIWSRAQDTEVPHDKTRAVAHADLERAYKDVKNLPPTPGRRPGLVGNIGTRDNAQARVPPYDLAGINTVGSKSLEQSSPQKRYERVFVNSPSVEGHSHQDNRTPQRSNRVTESRSSTSYPTLHNNGNRSSFAYGSVVPVQTSKRIPSRQELRDQLKLVRRVSNLEMKLEAARLKLSKSLDNTAISQPVRARRHKFVPGGLPSLPSESLLSGYIDQSESTDRPLSPIKIGAAITTDDKVSLVVATTHGEIPRRRSVSSYDGGVLSAPTKSNNELPVATSSDDIELGKQPTDSTRLHKINGGYKTDSSCDVMPNAMRPTNTRSKKRKSTGSERIGDDGSYKPSQYLDGRGHMSKKIEHIPTKKLRSRPERRLFTDSESPNFNLEKDNHETPDAVSPRTQPIAKHEGSSKLIVRKRTPQETQESRIPRKGGRKNTPSILNNENVVAHTVVSAASKPAHRCISDEVSPIDSADHTTKFRQRNPSKVAEPRLPTSLQELNREIEPKELRKPKGKKLSAVTTTKVGSSSESFEWGPDVF